MAKVRCIGCGKIQSAKKLDAFDGFAACRECHAVFDVTPEVETHSRRDAGFWPHGSIAEPSGVEVVVEGEAAPRLAGGYRENQRAGEGGRSLLLTCKTERNVLLSLTGAMGTVLCGVFLALFVQLGKTGALWLRVVPFVLIGLPGLAAVYALLVGIQNRARVQTDGLLLRVDEGPLPYPHEKSQVPVAGIARLCCHHDTTILRSGAKKTLYELHAWSRADRREKLLGGIRSATTAIYLQERLAAFLGLGPTGPVDLVKKDAETDE